MPRTNMTASGNAGKKRGRKAPRLTPNRKKKTPFEPSGTFPFLSLPMELRLKIYELALSNNGEPIMTIPDEGMRLGRSLNAPLWYRRQLAERVGGTNAADDGAARSRRNGRAYVRKNFWTKSEIPTPLLLTSKQIVNEATEYLYLNEIVVEDTDTLLEFLTTIGPANRVFLRRITVCSWPTMQLSFEHTNSASLSLLGEARGLECLQLALRQDSMGDLTLDQYDFDILAPLYSRLAGRSATKTEKIAAIDRLQFSFDATIEGYPHLAFAGQLRVQDDLSRPIDGEADMGKRVDCEFKAQLKQSILNLEY